MEGDYFAKSPDDRALYWVAELYRQMRWAGEDGHEESSIFTPSLLAGMRAHDPDIDALMSPILTRLARMWLEPPEDFLKNVNARLGSSYVVDPVIAKEKFTLP